MSTTVQYQDFAESREAFSQLLRSAPTAAIDTYNTLYARRSRSPSTKRSFIETTRIFGAALTFKHWDTCEPVDYDGRSAVESYDFVALGIETINGDIWRAIVDTELPIFWLDALLDQDAMLDVVRTSSLTPKP